MLYALRLSPGFVFFDGTLDARGLSLVSTIHVLKKCDEQEKGGGESGA